MTQGSFNYLSAEATPSLRRNGRVLIRRDRDGSDAGAQGLDLERQLIPLEDGRRSPEGSLASQGFELAQRPLRVAYRGGPAPVDPSGREARVVRCAWPTAGGPTAGGQTAERLPTRGRGPHAGGRSAGERIFHASEDDRPIVGDRVGREGFIDRGVLAGGNGCALGCGETRSEERRKIFLTISINVLSACDIRFARENN